MVAAVQIALGTPPSRPPCVSPPSPLTCVVRPGWLDFGRSGLARFNVSTAVWAVYSAYYGVVVVAVIYLEVRFQLHRRSWGGSSNHTRPASRPAASSDYAAKLGSVSTTEMSTWMTNAALQ